MSASRRSFLSLSLMLGVGGLAGAGLLERPARADGEPLILALYAPTAPLASAEARYAYVDKLARQLQSAGVPAQGKVFAKAADFESAIKRDQVDLAILDAFYVADRGASYTVLAVATAAGEPYLRWSLYTHVSSGNILDMAGKQLAWVAPTGKDKDSAYIGNVLLYGELKPTFFTLRTPAPDISAAVSDVALRRADCVFAPEPAVAGKSLRRVYDAGEAGRIPNPALVQISQKLSSEDAATVRRVVAGFNTTGILDGWRSGGGIGDAYRGLRQRLRGRPERSLIMAEPSRLASPVTSTMIQPVDTPPQLPGLRALLVPQNEIP